MATGGFEKTINWDELAMIAARKESGGNLC